MRVHFAIVAEASPAYCAMARLLAFTIRSRAGRLATAPIHVVFNDRADPATADELSCRWNAQVHTWPRLSSTIGFLNKYNALNPACVAGADWIIVLDCDTLICESLDPLAEWMDSTRDDVAAVPVLAKTAWGLEDIFMRFSEVSRDDLSRMTHPWFVSSYPYFNSGVIALRAAHAPAFQRCVLDLTAALYREMSTSLTRPIHSLRLRWNRKVCKRRDADRLVLGSFFTKFYAEQVGMSATILKLGLRYSVWPHAWNWRAPGSGHGEDSPIRILHYLGARYPIDRAHMLDDDAIAQAALAHGDHPGWSALGSALRAWRQASVARAPAMSVR